ncbi:FHA domain-containing protein DDL-like [Salvia miltiorrhiza]|uniref:FHA domain-containing protein DDL-like n=1 Tax=Salvia miltiorrhiza TaxID=226208 RepID=UPI0025AC9D3F|nr:FHA domain-containing protein DDL-like [Salvia miltiorrhiza]XP_057769061.1 FHA domain-containing protein DDL-like [Salvia miltiorrhiza]XP_057769062.1 FHA domain-containing protein DDL-like [Salvia miltiorrhiza]
MGRRNSVSPVRTDRSPRRRSPSRRERSPAHEKRKSPPNHRSSNADRLSSRTRSPKRARSRSPASHSPVREKIHSRTKPPNPRKSPSRSPIHVRQKLSSRTRSPNREKSRSPPPLSPRSKRLQRTKSERDADKGSEREYEKNHNRKSDRAAREEKELDRDLPVEKKERKLGRDAAGNGSRSRHERSCSPSDRHRRGQRRSRSPSTADNRGRNELANPRDDEDRNGDSEALAKMRAVEESLEAKEKHKPSFELSGKLAAETNRVRGVTLLFNEPPDARKPEVRWRLYVFKGGEVLNDPLYVHRQSCYLFGRERRVADIPTDHPSCSKQHSVLQYRQVEEENPDGGVTKRVRPYLMDLGSTNGTFVNDERLEPQRYYELFEKDTIKFGNSSREYVLLHENSTG